MIKTRLKRLEQLQGQAPHSLVAILKRLRTQQDCSKIAARVTTPPTLADTLAEIIERLPN